MASKKVRRINSGAEEGRGGHTDLAEGGDNGGPCCGDLVLKEDLLNSKHVQGGKQKFQSFPSANLVQLLGQAGASYLGVSNPIWARPGHGGIRRRVKAGFLPWRAL